MAHTKCKPKKGQHILDESVPEWQTFVAVQPVFASTVNWGRCRRHRELDSRYDETSIKQLNDFKFFQEDMKRLTDVAPSKDLSCDVYDSCIRTLTVLLDFLETLVQDAVLEVEPENDQVQEDQSGISQSSKSSSNRMFQKLSRFDRRGIKQLLPTMARKRKPGVAPTTTKTQIEYTHETTSETHEPDSERFKKLRILGESVAEARRNGQEVLGSCGSYLSSSQCIICTDGYLAVSGFVECMDSKEVSGTSPHFKIHIERTRWERTGPSRWLGLLFEVLSRNTQECKYGRGPHNTMVLLNGPWFEKEEIKCGVMIQKCLDPDSWHRNLFSSWVRSRMIASSNRTFIHNLCSFSRSAADKPDWHIVFEDKHKNLYATLPIQQPHEISGSITLRDCLEEGLFLSQAGGGALEERHKAILALSIAQCLLHLSNGSWMNTHWNIDSFVFPKTAMPSEILDIYHPYVSHTIEMGTANNTLVTKDRESTMLEGIEKAMLSFAQLLLEIFGGRALGVVTSDMKDGALPRDKLFDELDIQRKETDIPLRYHDAVHDCLNFKQILRSISRQNPNMAFEYRLRRTIYTQVIEPLEDHLATFRGSSDIHSVHNLRMKERTVVRDTPNDPDTMMPQRKGPDSGHISDACDVLISDQPPECPDSQRNHPKKRPHNGYSLFDGKVTYDKVQIEQAHGFLWRMNQFYNTVLYPKTSLRYHTGRRIRIAVLDTGIDPKDNSIKPSIDGINNQRRREYSQKGGLSNTSTPSRNPAMLRKEFNPIKETRNFLDPSHDPVDTCGHGTHVASLLLKVAPDADIFVGKIASDSNDVNMGAILEGISWAVNTVKVDIINMSFGIDSYHRGLDNAIAAAHGRGVIMFAAASNGGLNMPRTYPARHRCVMAVHAMSGSGEVSSMNPSHEDEHDRLGTLGVSIELSWKDKKEYRSGTSYATPIAAGIGANWLQWVRCIDTKGIDEQEINHWKSPDGVHRIFTKVLSSGSNIRYIAPWHMWTDNGHQSITDSDVVGALRRGLN